MKSSTHLQIYKYITNPACAPNRMITPARYLQEHSTVRVTLLHELTEQIINQICADGDILIIQRLPYSEGLNRVVLALNRARVLVVYDIDDDLLNLDPESLFAQDVAQEIGIETCQNQIAKSIEICQAIQCSTLALADVIRAINPAVSVFENQIETLEPLTISETGKRPLIIGYGAGLHHDLDWGTVSDSYNKVCDSLNGSGVNFETWIFGSEAVFNSIRGENKRLFPMVLLETYYSVLRYIDVSLMPLRDTHFNRSKSDIKFLEAASHGSACLASNVVYEKTITSSETGFIYSSPQAFQDQLEALATDSALRNRIIVNAYEYVQTHRQWPGHIAHWAETYTKWEANSHNLILESTKRRVASKIVL